MVRINFNTHQLIQNYLCSLFSNAHLEVRFPQIGRIADVVSGKCVFEIQVSPIALHEVQGRIRDYETLGMRVVWLLHDNHFNGPLLSRAESFLRARGDAYYARVFHPNKEVTLYDQFELINRRLRKRRSPPLPIDLKILTAKGFKGDAHDRSQLVPSWARKEKPLNRLKQLYLTWLDSKL